MSKNIELLKAIIKCASQNYDYIVLGDKELSVGIPKLKEGLTKNNIIGILDSRKSLLSSGFDGRYIGFHQEMLDLINSPAIFNNKRLGYLVKYSRPYLQKIDPTYYLGSEDNLNEKIDIIQINVENSIAINTYFENEQLLEEIIQVISSPMFLEKPGRAKTLNRK